MRISTQNGLLWVDALVAVAYVREIGQGVSHVCNMPLDSDRVSFSGGVAVTKTEVEES